MGEGNLGILAVVRDKQKGDGRVRLSTGYVAPFYGWTNMLALPGQVVLQVGKGLRLLAPEHSITDARADQQVGQNKKYRNRFFIPKDTNHEKSLRYACILMESSLKINSILVD
jgi:hypothetical protein